MKIPFIVFVVLGSTCLDLQAQQSSTTPANPAASPVPPSLNPRYQLSVWRAMDYIEKHPNSPLGPIFQTANYSLQSNAGITALQLTDARHRVEAEYAQRRQEAQGNVAPSPNLRFSCAYAHALVHATSKTAKELGEGDTKAKILAAALDSAGDLAVDNVCALIHQELSQAPSDKAKRVENMLGQLPAEVWRKPVEDVFARAMAGDQQAQVFVAGLTDYLGPVAGNLSVKEMLETNPDLRANLPKDMQARLIEADEHQSSLPKDSIKALLAAGGEQLLSSGEERRSDTARPSRHGQADMLQQKHDAERAQRREETYKAVESTALLVRQLAPLVGDANSSKVLLQGANILQNGAGLARSIDSLRNFSALRTAEAFTNVTGCLSVAITLFSGLGGLGGGDDGTTAILKEIQQLRQEVQQLRREMHQRFDRLEGELKDISIQMQQGFERIESLIDAVNKKVVNVQDQIGQLTNIATVTDQKLDIYTQEILAGLGEVKRGELNDIVDEALRGKRTGPEIRGALDKCVSYAKNRPIELIFVPPAHPDLGPTAATTQLRNPIRGIAVVGALLAGRMPGWSPPPHFNFAEWSVGAESFARIVAARRTELRTYNDADVKALATELLEPAKQNFQVLRGSLSLLPPQSGQATPNDNAQSDPYLQALGLYRQAILHVNSAVTESRRRYAAETSHDIDPWLTVDEASVAEMGRKDLWPQNSPQLLPPHPAWKEIAASFKIDNWDKVEIAQLPAPAGWESKIDPIFRVAHRAGRLFTLSGFHYSANQLVGAPIGPVGNVSARSKDPLKIKRLYAIGARIGEMTVMLGCLLEDGQFHNANDFRDGWTPEIQSRWRDSIKDTLPYNTPILLPAEKINIPLFVIMGAPKTYRTYDTDHNEWLDYRNLSGSEATVVARGQILRERFIDSSIFKTQAGFLLEFPPDAKGNGGFLYGTDNPAAWPGKDKSCPLKYTAAPLYTTSRWEWEAKRNECRDAVASWLTVQKQNFRAEVVAHQFDGGPIADALAELEEYRQLLLALLDLGYSGHLDECYAVREILPPTARIKADIQNDETGDKLRTLIDQLNTAQEEALQVIQQLRQEVPQIDPLDRIDSLIDIVEAVSEQVSPIADR